jgi:A/G-specific adenine glycosylase
MTARVTTPQLLLLAWFHSHGRRLPWRETRDPYAVLVAEMMLQQTQVDRVVPRYLAFLERFPTLADLAQASTAEVIREWAGLGYNRRALYLQRAARHTMERHQGCLPPDQEALRKLDGVGAYTAAAVACFAYGQQTPVLDTNVRRVLGRLFGGVEGLAEAALARVAQEALPEGEAWAWNQALMDLGATVCVQRTPRCHACPLRHDCRAAPLLQDQEKRVAESRAPYRAKAAPFKDSSRYYRGRIVAHLAGLPSGTATSLDSLGGVVKPGVAPVDPAWLLALVEGLQRDGLVALERGRGEHPQETRVSLPAG